MRFGISGIFANFVDMMSEEKYNFDCVVDRHDTCATKFEEMDRKFGRHDLLPFWIADMDFQACPAIIEALRNRLKSYCFRIYYTASGILGQHY